MSLQYNSKDLQILQKIDFSNQPIVSDFNLFVEYVINNKLLLTANDVISHLHFREINELLSTRIVCNKEKLSNKSFPNITALFLILRLSGLSDIETIKSKKYLIIRKDIYENWKKLNSTEQYFELLFPFIFRFSLEPINESASGYIFNAFSKNVIEKKDIENIPNYFKFFEYKIYTYIFSFFGFINIKARLELNGEWAITDFTTTEFGKTILKIILENHLVLYEDDNFLFNILNTDNGEIEDNEEEDVNEDFEIKKTFIELLKENVKDFNNRLELQQTIQQISEFIFEVKLLKTKLVISLSSYEELDILCQFILESVNFDYDHLYNVELKDNFGRKISFNGCPDPSMAEYPSTNDVKIGELPLKSGSDLKFTYDFGDWWEFEIKLLEIRELKNKKQKPKLISIKGEIPEQYSFFDDDSDE